MSAEQPRTLPRLSRQADFRKLWTGYSVSAAGSEVTVLAVPLCAAVLLGASAFQMGLLTAAATLPHLVVGLLAGVWVDRLPRRRPLLITADLLAAGALFTVPLAWWLGVLTVSQLVAVELVVGCCRVVFRPAYQSHLPDVVHREQLTMASGHLRASDSVAMLAGPGLGGLLVQAVSAPVAVVVDAISFVVSAVCIRSVRAPERAAAARTDADTEVHNEAHTSGPVDATRSSARVSGRSSRPVAACHRRRCGQPQPLRDARDGPLRRRTPPASSASPPVSSAPSSLSVASEPSPAPSSPHACRPPSVPAERSCWPRSCSPSPCSPSRSRAARTASSSAVIGGGELVGGVAVMLFDVTSAGIDPHQRAHRSCWAGSARAWPSSPRASSHSAPSPVARSAPPSVCTQRCGSQPRERPPRCCGRSSRRCASTPDCRQGVGRARTDRSVHYADWRPCGASIDVVHAALPRACGAEMGVHLGTKLCKPETLTERPETRCHRARAIGTADLVEARAAAAIDREIRLPSARPASSQTGIRSGT